MSGVEASTRCKREYMSSFDKQNTLVRRPEDIGEFILLPAAGLDDPRASDAGRALMHFFHERTGGTRLLKRSDFSPMDIKSYLVNIIIADLIYGEDGVVCDATVRLMGSGLSAFYGEHTGGKVLDHPSGAGVRLVMGAQEAIKAQSTVIGTSSQATQDRPLYKVATCMIPIVDDSGTVIQMLGHIYPYT